MKTLLLTFCIVRNLVKNLGKPLYIKIEEKDGNFIYIIYVPVKEGKYIESIKITQSVEVIVEKELRNTIDKVCRICIDEVDKLKL